MFLAVIAGSVHWAYKQSNAEIKKTKCLLFSPTTKLHCALGGKRRGSQENKAIHDCRLDGMKSLHGIGDGQTPKKPCQNLFNACLLCWLSTSLRFWAIAHLRVSMTSQTELVVCNYRKSGGPRLNLVFASFQCHLVAWKPDFPRSGLSCNFAVCSSGGAFNHSRRNVRASKPLLRWPRWQSAVGVSRWGKIIPRTYICGVEKTRKTNAFTEMSVFLPF